MLPSHVVPSFPTQIQFMICSDFGSSLDIRHSSSCSVIILSTVLLLKSTSSIKFSNSIRSSILELKTPPSLRSSSFTESHYSLYISLASPIFDSNSELKAMLIKGLLDNKSLFSRSSPPLYKASIYKIKSTVSSNPHTPISINKRTLRIKLVFAPSFIS